MKHGILVLGCAMAMLSAPVVFASSASAKECPSGTTATKWPGVCTRSGSNAPSFLPPGSDPGSAVVSVPGQVPASGALPCTPQPDGTCITLPNPE